MLTTILRGLPFVTICCTNAILTGHEFGLTLDIKHVFKDILNFCAVNAIVGKENIGQTQGSCAENDTDQHLRIQLHN